MADSLTEVLSAAKWEKALFTTYSLSLTFFESMLLRALRQVECQKIWVVADANGYHSSLMERGSSGVGHEYHLIPIKLRHGVFHPKCCYLVGDEFDILVIGSGNLTFGGFGRNLEVMEVLSSRADQACFNAFADFLSSLKQRTDVVCPDFSWAEEFSNRAYSVGAAHREPGDFPMLLTSVQDSVFSQLAPLISPFGEVQHLTVLSPFFDADGAAVLRLARETKAESIRIGLPLGNEPSAFPFPKARKWPVELSAVTLRRDRENRRLHAKWMEWKTAAGSVCLTGSVNATHQALCTTNNVEMGVLRFDPKGKGWATWRKSEIPSSYKSPPPTQPAEEESCLVFAELRDTGELTGKIITFFSPEGEWSGKIQKPGGESIGFEIVVKRDGQFSQYLTNAEDFLFASGLQVILTAGDRSARGWILNTSILNLPPSHRLSPLSLVRLINREETVDDDVALLEYFAIHALDHFRTFQSRIVLSKPPGEGSPQRQDAYSIDLEYLRPDAETSTPSTQAAEPIMSASIALERVFARLRRRLLGHIVTSPMHVAARAKRWDDTEEEELEEHDLRPGDARQRFDDAFTYFMERMHDLVGADELPVEYRRAILVLWLEVALHMLVRRRRDRDEAIAFLQSWFLIATSRSVAGSQVDALEQHLVTCAAILAGTDSHSEKLTPASLHESLEHYWRGTVDRGRAFQGLLPYSPLSLAGLFFDRPDINLQNFLTEILDASTLRSELTHTLDCCQHGATPPDDSPIFQSETGKELREELSKPERARQIEFLEEGAFVCPHRFIKLSEACKDELQRYRVARCSACGRFILRLSP